MKRTILLTGAGGMLGSAFRQALSDQLVLPVGRERLDTGRPDDVRALVKTSGAGIVINCAAETNVEYAEDHPDQTAAANARIPALLADGCSETGALMVQISSTGCYGSWKTSPYAESDEARPGTVYHREKLAGEDAVRASGARWLVLRAGWLYGGAPSSPKNFVARRLEEAQGKPRLIANAGQRGNPTFVADFARQALKLIDLGVTGLFNCVAHGDASRAEYVREIVDAAGLNCIVEDVPASQFVRRAPVSPNETAVNAGLAVLGLDIMSDWRVSLRSYVRSLV